jgi:hypothetical protein
MRPTADEIAEAIFDRADSEARAPALAEGQRAMSEAMRAWHRPELAASEEPQVAAMPTGQGLDQGQRGTPATGGAVTPEKAGRAINAWMRRRLNIIGPDEAEAAGVGGVE